MFSQSQLEDIRESTSTFYGTDDVLINGGVYTPLHPVASGNQYFIRSNFSKGSLSLVGRDFQNVDLKFDIEQQRLILKGFIDSVNFEIIVLNDNYIKEFVLFDYKFVNLSNYLNSKTIKGFYELIYSGSFVFVRSYHKEFLASYSNRYLNGKYSETKIENFIIRDNIKYEIKKNKNLFSVFPEQKGLIKKFMKDNKIKLRKASNTSLNKLMQYCDEVSMQ